MEQLPIHPYDIVMLAVLVLAAIFGAWKGMAWQVASLASVSLSVAAAVTFSPQLAPYLSQQEPWNRFLAMLILYVGTSLAVWLAFRMVSRVIERIKLKEFDAQMGAAFGLLKGALLCLVITFFAVTLSESARQSILASKSGVIIARGIQHATPVLPEEVRQAIGQYLDRLEDQLDPGYQPSTERLPLFSSGASDIHETIQKGADAVDAASDVIERVRTALPAAESLMRSAQEHEGRGGAPIYDEPADRATEVQAAPAAVAGGDLLKIDLEELVPQPPFTLRAGDVVRLHVRGTLFDHPLDGLFAVEDDGSLDLGPVYGAPQVAGLPVDALARQVQTHLRRVLADPVVRVELAGAAGLEPVGGYYPVATDGQVVLPGYGSIEVAGRSPAEAARAIEDLLAEKLSGPQVTVAIADDDAPRIEVLVESAGIPDAHWQLPWSDATRVGDAVRSVGGMSRLTEEELWIERPDAGGAERLTVSWNPATRSASPDYRLQAGDRLHILGTPRLAARAKLEQGRRAAQPVAATPSDGSANPATVTAEAASPQRPLPTAAPSTAPSPSSAPLPRSWVSEGVQWITDSPTTGRTLPPTSLPSGGLKR